MGVKDYPTKDWNTAAVLPWLEWIEQLDHTTDWRCKYCRTRVDNLYCEKKECRTLMRMLDWGER